MSVPSFSLEGKVAIVTGGSRGIGRAIALAFAESGAEVVVCSRTAGGALLVVASEIQKLGRRSIAIQADVSQKADVDNMVHKVLREFGAVDILVNNAGILILKPVLECSEADWNQLMNVNLKGCYLCSQTVGRVMIEQKRGNIINIASTSSFMADEYHYSVAKAGLVMLTRVLSKELAKHNIRVNAIAPGWVRTMLSESRLNEPGVIEYAESQIPMGWVAEPEDFNGAALFLASEASRYVTGHTLIVDGGLVASR
ncbi:SDR family NAD(P)-dependent oxidoreductase [Chloroflexota bacterium]